MQSLVTLSGVSFEFPNGRELFNNLSLKLNSGLTALVGANGAGKTTLAKLINGELEPSRGKIVRNGALGVFAQRENPPALTVGEYLGEKYLWSPWSADLLAKIEPTALCNLLSGGQWMRVRLASILDDRFLILDEPTNDLDREGREALLKFLCARTGGSLVISHDRECLALCTEVLELSNQGVAKFGGGWRHYCEEKERESEALKRALAASKRARDRVIEDGHELRLRQEKRGRRGAKAAAKGGLPKILSGARKRRAQVSSGKLASETIAKNQAAVRELHQASSALKVEPVMFASLKSAKIPEQTLVAEGIDFNIRFQNWLYPQNLNFRWRGNIRLALSGANGAGKSILLKAILGAQFETRGTLRNGGLRTLSIDQRCASLDDGKSVLENVRALARGDEGAMRGGLARFLFMNDSVFQKAGELSGGERLRAALAQGFLAEETPELLILDEPTNNLDLANIEFLERLLREFNGALIVISHDRDFLKNCGVKQEFAVGGPTS